MRGRGGIYCCAGEGLRFFPGRFRRPQGWCTEHSGVFAKPAQPSKARSDDMTVSLAQRIFAGGPASE